MQNQDVILSTKSKPFPIPTYNKCSIALNLNLYPNDETIIIGEYSDIINYIEFGNNSEKIIVKKRPFGTLLFESFYMLDNYKNDFIPVYKELEKVLSKGTAISETYFAQNTIYNIYTGDNYLLKYYMLQLYNNFRKYRYSNFKIKNIPDILTNNIFKKLGHSFNNISSITNNYFVDIISFINEQMNNVFLEDINFLKTKTNLAKDNISSKVINGQILSTISNNTCCTYVISSDSPLSLLTHYFNIMSYSDIYIQPCIICGKLFFTNKKNRSLLCSEKCKKIRRATQAKNRRSNLDPYSPDGKYQHTYTILNNNKSKIRRILKIKPNDNLLSSYNKFIEDYCFQGNQKSAQLKNGEINLEEFENWLYSTEETSSQLCNDIINSNTRREYNG